MAKKGRGAEVSESVPKIKESVPSPFSGRGGEGVEGVEGVGVGGVNLSFKEYSPLVSVKMGVVYYLG